MTGLNPASAPEYRGTEARVVSFIEAGHEFVLMGPMTDGLWWIDIASPDGTRFAMDAAHFDEACGTVDSWLARRPDDAKTGMFAGYIVEAWSHEERMMRRLRYATRGELLRWFDDGSMPSPEEIADAAGWNGDMATWVWNRDGVLLVDRVETVRAKLAGMFPAEDVGFDPSDEDPAIVRRPGMGRGSSYAYDE